MFLWSQITSTILFLIIILLFYINVTEAQPKYSDNEKNTIQQFRELVKDDLYMDYMKSDTFLIKWLRSKKFNQNDAHEMLKKALKWRKDNKVDGIKEEKLYENHGKVFFTDGTDYNGSLVGTILSSRFDLRSLIVSGKRNSVAIRYFIQFAEISLYNIMERVGAIGNNTKEGTTTDVMNIVFNLNGYNLRQHGCFTCFGVFFEWLNILENYYPGYLKNLFFINAPRIFGPLFELLKPLMSEETRNVTKLFGTNKLEWYNVITKIIPTNELRIETGGTKSI